MAIRGASQIGAIKLNSQLEIYSDDPRFLRIYLNFRSMTKQRAAGGAVVKDQATGKVVGFQGRHHTKAYDSYRESFRSALSIMRVPMFVGPVWVAIGFGFVKNPPGDTDNYEGWVLDACQGFLYPNDNAVWVGGKQRYRKAQEDFIEIFIGQAQETQTERGMITTPAWRGAWQIVSTTLGLSTESSC